MSSEALPPSHVIVALEDASIPYLVVGGVAAILYGSPRTTADLDLWVREEDLERIPLEGLSDHLIHLARQTFEETGFALIVLDDADLLLRHSFDEAYARAERIEGMWVVPRDILIEMKQERGSPTDRFDMDFLEGWTCFSAGYVQA